MPKFSMPSISINTLMFLVAAIIAKTSISNFVNLVGSCTQTIAGATAGFVFLFDRVAEEWLTVSPAVEEKDTYHEATSWVNGLKEMACGWLLPYSPYWAGYDCVNEV